MELAADRQPPTPVVDQPAQYERFSDSELWVRQRAYFQQAGVEAWRRGEVPHYITSTAGAAQVYADAVVAYWQAAQAAGDVDPAQPLYVLELGAGCGRFTYLLLRALRGRLAHLPELRWCLLASDIVDDNLDFIAAHPYLRAEREAGRLDTVLWDAEEGGPLRLRAQGLRPASLANPLAVVANYVFDGLRQDLFGFARGALLEGRVAVREEELAYEWQPIAGADWLPASWQPLLARYAQRLPDTALLLPTGALRCLEHLAGLARAGHLLLSADRGAYSEQQLRSGCGADLAVHGSFSLPVNYHALSDFLQRQGARTCNTRHREDGLVYHASLRAPRPERYAACFAGIAQALEDLNPDDHFTLKKAVEVVAAQLAPEQLLAVLRLARHDYRVLAFMIDALLPQLPALDAGSRRLWQRAIERCWENYFPLGEDDGFDARFAELAAALGHWSLARQALQLDAMLHGEAPGTLHQLAQFEAATGSLGQAIATARRALELAPTDAACIALSTRLQARAAARARFPWYPREPVRDGELALEPLEIDHAASLLEQYRDPQIGAMTRLPDLQTLEEAVEWIVEQRGTPGMMACAVMHACWGFTGVVALRRDGDAGYFHFWIGTDHQGKGMGRRAAALLFEAAAAAGVREVFTSAYADNLRSRGALAALGFARVPAAAAAPDEELLFFHRALDPACGAGDDPVPRLQRLCGAIGSPMQIAREELP